MSVFLFGVTSFVGDISETFPATNLQNTSYMDKSAELNDKLGDMQSGLQSGGDQATMAEIMLTGVWKVLSLVIDTLDIFVSLIQDMFNAIGLGGFAVYFIGIVTIVMIYEIVILILNRT